MASLELECRGETRSRKGGRREKGKPTGLRTLTGQNLSQAAHSPTASITISETL